MSLKTIQTHVNPLIEKLARHELHGLINSNINAKIFMENHVFAVWDFMNILKTLQHIYAPSLTPWLPSEHPAEVTRFVNEIVLDEESDSFPTCAGKVYSHFNMYMIGMSECGAETNQINNFLSHLQCGCSLRSAVDLSDLPENISLFLTSNNALLDLRKPHAIAATFCYGREVSLPKMFKDILSTSFPRTDETKTFKTYIERHVELDQESHADKAMSVLNILCKNNPYYWAEATAAATTALKIRLEFWDSIKYQIEKSSSISS